MHVITRSLMATALLVYGLLHGLEAVAAPSATPAWAAAMFAASALVAAGLALGLLLAPVDGTVRLRLQQGAALLASASSLVLFASSTVGFFGVHETSLRAATVVVVIAEIAIVLAYAAQRLVDRSGLDDAPEGDSGIVLYPRLSPRSDLRDEHAPVGAGAADTEQAHGHLVVGATDAH